MGGQTATALINQINVAPRAVRRGPGRKILFAVLAGGGAAGAILASRGGSGNSGPQPPPGTSITPGSPVFGPPR